MTNLCTKEQAGVQDIKVRFCSKTWDLKANPKAVQGLKLIMEAVELQSDWGKFVSQIVKNGKESDWYIEVRLCKKE